MFQFLNENKKVHSIFFIALVVYLAFFGGSLIQSIFEIGRQVGTALAQWF